jgi:hypothetical protein
MTTPTQTPSLYFLPFQSPNRTPSPHIQSWGGGEAGLAYGLGLRSTRAPREMCRGIPGHKSLRPCSMWSHPWTLSRATRTDRPPAAGYPGLSTQRFGAGPARAEARRHLRLGVAGYPDASSYMDAGYPGHVWGCRCHPGTMTYEGSKTDYDFEGLLQLE